MGNPMKNEYFDAEPVTKDSLVGFPSLLKSHGINIFEKISIVGIFKRSHEVKSSIKDHLNFHIFFKEHELIQGHMHL
jgi:hypothetical protein